MTGAGLKRYTPQGKTQGGGGFVKDLLRDVIEEGVKGFKSDPLHPKRAIRAAASRAKGAAKRAVKRKAQEEITKISKRALKDIFDPPVPTL